MADDNDDTSMISFPGDQEDFDDAPQGFKDHMVKAFEHKAGLGPHPGKYQGPPLKMREGDEQDDRGVTDADRQRAREEPFEEGERPREAGYQKMKAARSGGPPLGPSEMEKAAVQQGAAIGQAASTGGAVQAAKAQAAPQTPNAPPPAPGGPVGVSEPYAAQREETAPGIPEAPSGPPQ